MAMVSPIIVNPFIVGPATTMKDSHWLTLDVCREYTRSKCTRTEDECRFAHPPANIEVQNGRVMCCFDSIKGKCTRRVPPCKYLHPPQHLKDQLLQNGRNNLIMKHMQMQAIANGLAGMYPVSHQYLMHNGTAFNPFYAPAVSSSTITAAGGYPTTSIQGGTIVSSAPFCLPPPCLGAPLEMNGCGGGGGSGCGSSDCSGEGEGCGGVENCGGGSLCQTGGVNGYDNEKMIHANQQDAATSAVPYTSSFIMQPPRPTTTWRSANDPPTHTLTSYISTMPPSGCAPPPPLPPTAVATYCSPVYYQGTNGTVNGMVPVLKPSPMMDNKGTTIYQSSSAGPAYRQMMIATMPYPQPTYMPVASMTQHFIGVNWDD